MSVAGVVLGMAPVAAGAGGAGVVPGAPGIRAGGVVGAGVTGGTGAGGAGAVVVPVVLGGPAVGGTGTQGAGVAGTPGVVEAPGAPVVLGVAGVVVAPTQLKGAGDTAGGAVAGGTGAGGAGVAGAPVVLTGSGSGGTGPGSLSLRLIVGDVVVSIVNIIVCGTLTCLVGPCPWVGPWPTPGSGSRPFSLSGSSLCAGVLALVVILGFWFPSSGSGSPSCWRWSLYSSWGRSTGGNTARCPSLARFGSLFWSGILVN